MQKNVTDRINIEEKNMDEKIWHKIFKQYLDDYYAIHKLNKDGIIEFEHMQTLLSKLLDDIMTTFDSEVN